MKYHKIYLIILLCLSLNSCKNESVVEEKPVTKSKFGAAIDKAHGASDVSDERNERMKKQADSFKDE